MPGELGARDLAMAGDERPIPVAQRGWFQEALLEPDARRSLRLHARNVVRLHRQAADLAGADDELRELWQTAERQRRTDAASFIDTPC